MHMGLDSSKLRKEARCDHQNSNRSMPKRRFGRMVYRAESQRRLRLSRMRDWSSEPSSRIGMKILTTILPEYCHEAEWGAAQGGRPKGYATMPSFDTGTTSASSKP